MVSVRGPFYCHARASRLSRQGLWLCGFGSNSICEMVAICSSEFGRSLTDYVPPHAALGTVGREDLGVGRGFALPGLPRRKAEKLLGFRLRGKHTRAPSLLPFAAYGKGKFGSLTWPVLQATLSPGGQREHYWGAVSAERRCGEAKDRQMKQSAI